MTIRRVCALLSAAISAALLSVAVVPANAADLGYGSIKDVPAPVSSRAWYLKGTIGMKNESPDSIWTDGHGNDGYQTGFFDVHHADIKSTAFYGLGIGLEYNRWLRFDVTGEYRGKQLFVAQDSYNNGGACPGAGCGTNEYTADIESWLGLFNAYVDLYTWRGITPYVGAGIGVSSMDVQGFKDVNVPQGSVFYGDNNHTSTNFAWALYAGMSYDVSPNLTLDLAYRYADLGDAETGRATAFDGSDSYKGLEIRDITSHDLLFSARYRLDSPQPVYGAIK
jgi:opacity protein-like surface antigen